MSWQLQEAKQRLSELIDRALKEGPQTVTRRGKETVVVLAVEEFERLRARKPDFRRFLLEAPAEAELPLDRARETPRDVEL